MAAEDLRYQLADALERLAAAEAREAALLRQIDEVTR